MAISLLTSKLLAAGAGALAGYLLYKPERTKGGNNGGKNKETKSNDSYVPTSSEVITATANIQRAENPYVFGRVIEGDVTDSRINSAFYFGDKNKPYDPFYDYTGFQYRTEIDSLAASNPLAILRARIIPEYTAVAKRFVDFVGDPKYNKGNNNANAIIVKNYCVDIRFRVEVFNPAAYPIAINKLGIETISYNNTKMYKLAANYKYEPPFATDNTEGKTTFVDLYSPEYLSENNLHETDGIKYRIPYYMTSAKFASSVAEYTKQSWSWFFTYPNYTPENLPAQGSFFQDYFLTDLYPEEILVRGIRINPGAPNDLLTYDFPTAAQPNLLVGLKFANDDTSTEGVIYTSLYSGNQPPTVPVDYKFNYISENFGNVYAGLLDAKNAGIVDMWQTIHEKYDAAFDSSFGVYMAAYWYLWAVNKAALEAKIKSILGVDPKEFDLNTTPARKLQLLKNELLTLWRNVFKSTELTIAEAENTYKEAYKNDVTKGVTLLPSLKYWAELADGAAPESIAPGTSSRTSNPNRNAVPNYRGTSAGTSTTTTTGSGLSRGGSSTTTTTTTSSGSGTSTRGVNGMAPGYQAASM